MSENIVGETCRGVCWTFIRDKSDLGVPQRNVSDLSAQRNLQRATDGHALKNSNDTTAQRATAKKHITCTTRIFITTHNGELNDGFSQKNHERFLAYMAKVKKKDTMHFLACFGGLSGISEQCY